jgi:hypothetical protein
MLHLFGLLKDRYKKTSLCKPRQTAEHCVQVAAETNSNSYWAGICAPVQMWKKNVHKDRHYMKKDNYAFSNVVVKICEVFTCVNCTQHKT